MGSLGPRDVNQIKQSYGLDFPVITIRDMVRAQSHYLNTWDKKTFMCNGRIDGWYAAFTILLNIS